MTIDETTPEGLASLILAFAGIRPPAPYLSYDPTAEQLRAACRVLHQWRDVSRAERIIAENDASQGEVAAAEEAAAPAREDAYHYDAYRRACAWARDPGRYPNAPRLPAPLTGGRKRLRSGVRP